MAKPGAEVEPHQPQFLHTQGPVARREFGHSLRFCAPEIFCLVQGVTPVIGDRGPTPPVRGRWPKARGGRVGEYGHEVSILSRPPAILKVNCPEGAREGGLGHWFLSHRRERNPPPAGGEISPCERRNDRMKPRSETKFRTKFFCLLSFQEKQVNSSSSAWVRESARPGPRRPWRRRGGPAAPGRSPAGRRTPPYLPPACRGRG